MWFRVCCHACALPPGSSQCGGGEPGPAPAVCCTLLPQRIPPLPLPQAVLFLGLHTVPIALAFLGLPDLLLRAGQPREVTRLLKPYLLALLPGVWVDAVYRCA